MQYYFDEFVLDTDRFVLLQQGSSIHAEPQVIELIRYLLERRGRLVSRDELNREIWKGRVVSDAAPYQSWSPKKSTRASRPARSSA